MGFGYTASVGMNVEIGEGSVSGGSSKIIGRVFLFFVYRKV